MSISLRTLSSYCYAIQRNYWGRLWHFPRGFGLPATIAKRLTDVPLWTELEPGVKMLLDPRELISRVLLETGEWDPEAWQPLLRICPPGARLTMSGPYRPLLAEGRGFGRPRRASCCDRGQP